MESRKQKKHLLAQLMAVLSALFLVYHYAQNYEEYHLKNNGEEEGRDLLMEELAEGDISGGESFRSTGSDWKDGCDLPNNREWFEALNRNRDKSERNLRALIGSLEENAFEVSKMVVTVPFPEQQHGNKVIVHFHFNDHDGGVQSEEYSINQNELEELKIWLKAHEGKEVDGVEEDGLTYEMKGKQSDEEDVL